MNIEQRLTKLEETVGIDEKEENGVEILPGDDHKIKNSKWWELIKSLGFDFSKDFDFEDPPRFRVYELVIKKKFFDLEYQPVLKYLISASQGESGNFHTRLQRHLSYRDAWDKSYEPGVGYSFPKTKKLDSYKELKYKPAKNSDEFIDLLEVVAKDILSYEKVLNRTPKIIKTDLDYLDSKEETFETATGVLNWAKNNKSFKAILSKGYVVRKYKIGKDKNSTIDFTRLATKRELERNFLRTNIKRGIDHVSFCIKGKVGKLERYSGTIGTSTSGLISQRELDSGIKNLNSVDYIYANSMSRSLKKYNSPMTKEDYEDAFDFILNYIKKNDK